MSMRHDCTKVEMEDQEAVRQVSSTETLLKSAIEYVLLGPFV